MLNFPDSPTAGTVFGAWRYDGVKWGAVSGVSGGGSAGDITAVLAGAGLSGGGTEGDVSIALAVPVTVARGGTGATDAATARTNLGAAPLDQTVTLTGDIAGSGAQNSSIATTLAPVNLASKVTGVLPIANGGTGAATGAVGPYLPIVAGSGNALTGALTIAATSSEIYLNKSASGQNSAIYGKTGTSTRWGLFLGDFTAESGSQAGSNFAVYRYNDAGTLVGTTLTCNRATGITTVRDLTVSHADNSLVTIGFDNGCNIQMDPGGKIYYFNIPAGLIWCMRDSDKLAFNNLGAVAGMGGYVNLASFAKYKSNVRAIPSPAERLKKLKPVAYTYDPLGHEQTGFVIEDLVEAYPEAVSYGPDGKPQGYQPDMLIAGLTAALQDALRRIEALEGK